MGSRIKSKDSNSLRGHNISSTAPSNGEALVYNGTEYTPNAAGGATIYTADGTLTGDRELELDSHKLTFKGRLTANSDRIESFIITAQSGE